MPTHSNSSRDMRPGDDRPVFRSGVVARLAQMPVATLRIWEQRYAAVQPSTAPSGHRLYSAADLQRVGLLRQLTERGHAIGSIATLDSAQLQQLLQRASSAGGPDDASRRAGGLAASRRRLQLLVVGESLAARLQRPAMVKHGIRLAPRVIACESLGEAARARARADVLLWQVPALSAELPRELRAAREAARVRRVVVLYRFASTEARQALARADVMTIREPADDEALGAWLASLETDLGTRAVRASRPPAARGPAVEAAVLPRRYDDAVLTTIAGIPPGLACECPRHVAELLMQISSFESYSASCAHRHADDAQLHAYLQQVAGSARALFETALERVALHEGLSLG
jgi:DNA-binding transcriptional MerR regulator